MKDKKLLLHVVMASLVITCLLIFIDMGLNLVFGKTFPVINISVEGQISLITREYYVYVMTHTKKISSIIGHYLNEFMIVGLAIYISSLVKSSKKIKVAVLVTIWFILSAFLINISDAINLISKEGYVLECVDCPMIVSNYKVNIIVILRQILAGILVIGISIRLLLRE